MNSNEDVSLCRHRADIFAPRVTLHKQTWRDFFYSVRRADFQLFCSLCGEEVEPVFRIKEER